eukprot:3030826-Alexandrium_andersonii.AAC.1
MARSSLAHNLMTAMSTSNLDDRRASRLLRATLLSACTTTFGVLLRTRLDCEAHARAQAIAESSA